MSEVAFEQPVQDSVPKINDEVAVGEDLEFQRRWWKFESVMWCVFAIILLLDLAGLFGRGPLAHGRIGNGEIDVRYERVERTGTPSILQVEFKNETASAGTRHLFVSQSVVEELGAQRVIPSPTQSMIGNHGLTYTFPVNGPDAKVELALQPAHPGIYDFSIGIAGEPVVQARVVVVP